MSKINTAPPGRALDRLRPDHQYGHYNGAIDYFTHVRDGGFDWHRDDKVCRDEGYSTHLIAREAARLIDRPRRRQTAVPLHSIQRRA